MIKAVIDIGSNSVILLVQRFERNHWALVHERTWVTGLGSNTKATGLLEEEAMQKTLAALKQAYGLAHHYHADEIIAAATMAVRIANNASQFINRAKEQNTPVRVLSGNEEAEYSFQAIAYDHAFSKYDLISVVDIGGQSTELIIAEKEPKKWNILFKYSYPIGTLHLLGGTLHQECPDVRSNLLATKEIDDIIHLEHLPNNPGKVIVVGATGTNLITIREKMTEWDPRKVHGSYLSLEEIDQDIKCLSSMTNQQRAEIIGMEPGREKTLHIGALILERFLANLKAPGCFVSVRGWRHALLEQPLNPYN